MKDMVENTDFDADLDKMFREEGLDRPPDFDFLKKKERLPGKGFEKRNPRLLKIAGFILAVLVVSSAMTIAINSQFASAAKFKLDNFFFSVRNGFFSSDIQFSDTSLGSELLIEDETQIAIGKNYLHELKTPGYIPDSYTFSQLQITNNPQGEYTAMYVYKNDSNDSITIMQARVGDYNSGANLFGVEEEFYIGDFHIFYVPDVLSEYNSLYAFTELEEISVNAPLERDELVNILKWFQ